MLSCTTLRLQSLLETTGLRKNKCFCASSGVSPFSTINQHMATVALRPRPALQ